MDKNKRSNLFLVIAIVIGIIAISSSIHFHYLMGELEDVLVEKTEEADPEPGKEKITLKSGTINEEYSELVPFEHPEDPSYPVASLRQTIIEGELPEGLKLEADKVIYHAGDEPILEELRLVGVPEKSGRYFFVIEFMEDYYTQEYSVIINPEEEDLSINIEKEIDNIDFTLNTQKEINVPQSGRWDQYYPEIYRKEEGEWKKLNLTLECAPGPRCNEPCDAPIIACEALPYPPLCETIDSEYTYQWNREYRISQERDCNGEKQTCYEMTPAKQGEYKIVFSYKTNECPVFESFRGEELRVFGENIETIEKTFSIE